MATTPGKVDELTTWKRCSTCRGAIAYGSLYYVCSVSTCNRARITYRFCKVECWEEHLPLMRHREAWAVEETAPTRAAWLAESEPAATEVAPKPAPAPKPTPTHAPAPDQPRRRIVGSAPQPAAAPSPSAKPSGAGSDEVLVVVSRFKTYVRERFGVNTSDAVLDVLSDHLRAICHRAVDNAREDGRKTLMDRDFEFLRRR